MILLMQKLLTRLSILNKNFGEFGRVYILNWILFHKEVFLPQKIEQRVKPSVRPWKRFCLLNLGSAAFTWANRNYQDNANKHSDEHSTKVIEHGAAADFSSGFGIQCGESCYQACHNKRQDQQLEHVHEELARKPYQHDSGLFPFWVFDVVYGLVYWSTDDKTDNYAKNN